MNEDLDQTLDLDCSEAIKKIKDPNLTDNIIENLLSFNNIKVLSELTERNDLKPKYQLDIYEKISIPIINESIIINILKNNDNPCDLIIKIIERQDLSTTILSAIINRVKILDKKQLDYIISKTYDKVTNQNCTNNYAQLIIAILSNNNVSDNFIDQIISDTNKYIFDMDIFYVCIQGRIEHYKELDELTPWIKIFIHLSNMDLNKDQIINMEKTLFNLINKSKSLYESIKGKNHYIEDIRSFYYILLSNYNCFTINILKHLVTNDYINYACLSTDSRFKIFREKYNFYKDDELFLTQLADTDSNYRRILLEKCENINIIEYIIKNKPLGKDDIKILNARFGEFEKQLRFVNLLLNSCKDDLINIVIENTTDQDLLTKIILESKSEEQLELALNNNSIDDVNIYLIYLLNDLNRRKIHKFEYLEYKYNINFLHSSKKEKELMQDLILRISKYVNHDNEISDTSLIQSSDEVSINENGNIIIKPKNFDLITASNNEAIKYGYYPLIKVNTKEEKILNILYETKSISKSIINKHIVIDNKYYFIPVYSVNGNDYIRIKSGIEYKWIKFVCVRWKINKEDNILEMIDKINGIENITEKDLKHFLSIGFKETVFEPYKITKEEKNNKNVKFKLINEKKIENDKKEFLEAEYKKTLVLLDELNKSFQILEQNNMISSDLLSRKIQIPDDLLIKKVNDHFEINPDLLPYLKYIDLCLVSSENLKLSGLDLKYTNLRIDPQLVYKKDLSNTILSDDNVVWGSFIGVDLRGSNIENETESYGYDKAIIDDKTKLPKRKVVSQQL